jgi:long-chain acyl-CoA synthetase
MPVNHDACFAAYLSEERHLALMMRKRVRRFQDKIAMADKASGAWRTFSWNEFGRLAEAVAGALLNRGVNPGDRIGIFSQNRACWTIADVGILSVRGVVVPVYATNSAEELTQIIDDAEVRILFLNDQAQYDKAIAVRGKSHFLEVIVVFDETVRVVQDNRTLYFSKFTTYGPAGTGDAGEAKELKARLAAATPDDLYTLIYTSGTSGPPKGVMLTHRNALAALYATGCTSPLTETDVSLSFLPLSHVFERSWNYYVLSNGAENYYCHDTGKLEAFLGEVRPHYMASVPRVWEKMYGTIMKNIELASPLKKRLFDWALRVGGRYYTLKNKNRPVGVGLKLRHKAALRLVLGRIQAAVGGRAKVFHVGGAPFSAGINEFFVSTGICMGLGYGLTEIFPLCVCTPEDMDYGTSGRPIPLTQIRRAADGEIQARSPAMMKGYWKQPEATQKALTNDGWLKTGDIGYITKEGYVKITGRIKEIIITSGGKNISPQAVEASITKDIYVEQAVAVGDGRKFVSALVVPVFPTLETWFRQMGFTGLSRQELVRHPDVIAFYKERIDQHTKALGQSEKIKRFTLLPEYLSQESGELTPTQKLKRKTIQKRYQMVIDAMYNEY